MSEFAFDRSARSIDADGRMHVERSGIYAITTPSGAQYIGSAIHFGKRWKRHLTYLRSGTHHSAPLQRAFAKYGEEGFEFSIILVCDQENLLEYEQRAIDAINPEYNICRVAGSHLGVKRSAETSARMSEAQRRRAPPTKETREKMRALKLGKSQSNETKEKRSASLKAHYSSQEARNAAAERNRRSNANPDTREKISAALTGIKRSDETRARMSAAQIGHVSKQKGIPRSDEVKAKISATKRANASRKKNAELK